MSSVWHPREFDKTIVQLEEEVDRQRRLLCTIWTPQISLHRIDLQQHYVRKGGEVLTNQQRSQERNSSLEQEEEKPPQMQVEQDDPEPLQMLAEEHCVSQDEQQLVLNQETDSLMVTRPSEERVCSKPEANWDQPLSHNHPEAENQDQEGNKNENSESSKDKLRRNKRSCRENVDNPKPKRHPETQTAKKDNSQDSSSAMSHRARSSHLRQLPVTVSYLDESDLDYKESDEEEEDDDNERGAEVAERQRYLSKDGTIQWWPYPQQQLQQQHGVSPWRGRGRSCKKPRLSSNPEPPPTAAATTTATQVAIVPSPQQKGPSQLALNLSADRDILSAFRVFFSTEVEHLVLDATKGRASQLVDWRDVTEEGRGEEEEEESEKDTDDDVDYDDDNGDDDHFAPDEIELRAYLGLLILTGVYRSRGESVASLWGAESGRAIFAATMPMKRFYALSSLVGFDDRSTRAERREAIVGGNDKLAAIRQLWDTWSARLPEMYVPGPEVTVDEHLVPFRGQCPFRQYIPSKPGKYGIKLWVACDVKSSYVWKMSVYMGKEKQGTTAAAKENSEKERDLDLSMGVVLEVTRGLKDRNVTCNNFFTSYQLAKHLLSSCNNTLVGTMHKNKPELPPVITTFSAEDRAAFSTVCAYTPTAALVSYVPKRDENMLLLSTLHRQGVDIALDHEDKKPLVLLHYNSNKGAVDKLDKLLAAYSCRTMTRRWTMALFHNILDVSAYNAFVLWRETNPDWMPRTRHRRRLFLEQLGRALVTPLVERRGCVPRNRFSGQLFREVWQRQSFSAVAVAKADSSVRALLHRLRSSDSASFTFSENEPATGKRRRCQLCPRKKDRKTATSCNLCSKYVCGCCSRSCCLICLRIQTPEPDDEEGEGEGDGREEDDDDAITV